MRPNPIEYSMSIILNPLMVTAAALKRAPATHSRIVSRRRLSVARLRLMVSNALTRLATFDSRPNGKTTNELSHWLSTRRTVDVRSRNRLPYWSLSSVRTPS